MEPTREAATFCEARGATCDAELLAAVSMRSAKAVVPADRSRTIDAQRAITI